MSDPVSWSLPALSVPNSMVRYKGIPKRYEETRPVFIQGNTHGKILGIGHELEKRVKEKSEVEKQKAIREAERAVWAEAEQIKAVALQKAKDEAAIDQERALKKLMKQHDKALKEEALRVEMAMQKLAIEQVKQERSEAEERLKEAVHKTEIRCHAELLEAVEKARLEEKKVAAEKAAKIIKEANERLDIAIKKAAEEKKVALKELEEKKDIERKKAVDEMEVAQKKITEERLQKLKEEHEKIVEKFEQGIHELQMEIMKLRPVIATLEKEKANIIRALLEMKTDFQHFVDNLPESIKGQVDYMVRPVFLDEIGRGVTII